MRISSNAIVYQDSVVQIANITNAKILSVLYYGEKSRERDAEYERSKKLVNPKALAEIESFKRQRKKENRFFLKILLSVVIINFITFLFYLFFRKYS